MSNYQPSSSRKEEHSSGDTNTEHDYMGRSTGAGALAHLKDTEVKDWADSEYTGNVIKISAGVQGFEVGQALTKHGLVAVTGECPTVGVAGGYTQGGGHPLPAQPDGKFVKASPHSRKHADLFFALSGSGAGNYGVVVSVTLKAHPEAMTSGAGFTLDDPSLDYPAIVNAWHAALPAILDAGIMAIYYAEKGTLVVYALTGYNRTQADMEKILAPFVKSVASLNVDLKPKYTQFGTYSEFYYSYFGPLLVGVFGSASETSWVALGVRVIGQATNIALFASHSRAVLPQWRDTLIMSFYTLPYSFDVPFTKMKTEQDYITNTIMQIIEKVIPDAGAYINKLISSNLIGRMFSTVKIIGGYWSLRSRMVRRGCFWDPIAVGSEGWKTQNDGKLCRA
ncbi:FAD-binding type 2 [Penicillium cf. griseofulvum]|nr:FAD-binding type 2 [Penicillium cf. griseofulvum]